MILVRVNGKSYTEDLMFNIDYGNLYNELGQYHMNKNGKCLLSILGELVKDKTLLFQYTEFDDNLSKDKEFFSNSYFMDYHKHGYRHIADEVKDILIKHHIYDNDVMIDEMKDQLLTKLKSTPIDYIDKALLEDIKHFIYKKHFKTRVSDYSEEVQDFVDKRVSTVMYDYGFPYIDNFRCQDRPVDFVRDLWINIDTKEDIAYWLKSTSEYFVCAINNKNSIEDYEYLLKYDWSLINGSETLVLDVLEGNKGDFTKKVFPLIEEELGFKIKQVDWKSKKAIGNL